MKRLAALNPAASLATTVRCAVPGDSSCLFRRVLAQRVGIDAWRRLRTLHRLEVRLFLKSKQLGGDHRRKTRPRGVVVLCCVVVVLARRRDAVFSSGDFVL